LPFATKPKVLKKKSQKKDKLTTKGVILEPHEKRVATLIQQINTVRNDKLEKEKATKKRKLDELIKKKKRTGEVDEIMDKQRRKEYYREEGKKAKVAERKFKKQKSKKDE
jgi:ribosome biogenesis protein BMS1